MTVSTLLRGNEDDQNIPSYMPSILTAARGHRGSRSDKDGYFPERRQGLANQSGLMRTAANEDVAGAGGFEPPYGGIKIHCLTTWRRPNKAGWRSGGTTHFPRPSLGNARSIDGGEVFQPAGAKIRRRSNPRFPVSISGCFAPIDLPFRPRYRVVSLRSISDRSWIDPGSILRRPGGLPFVPNAWPSGPFHVSVS